MNHLVDDDIDFAYYEDLTDAQEKVRHSSKYIDDAMHQLAPAHEVPNVQRMPFANCLLYFRPGEVTIWAGDNGSGKSMLQGQIMAQFAKKDPACIASFEMQVGKTLARIARQVTQSGRPTRDQVTSLFENSHLWLYDQLGTVKQERVYGMIKHCADRLGCKHVAVDSLLKCVKGEDDYNGQKAFVDELTAIAKDFNTHIHLVAHMRKSDERGNGRKPGKADIRGTAAITDLADNVILMWRNRDKEKRSQEGEEVDKHEPDAVLICEKQRNGDWEGRTNLYYNPVSLRYTDKPVIL